MDVHVPNLNSENGKGVDILPVGRRNVKRNVSIVLIFTYKRYIAPALFYLDSNLQSLALFTMLWSQRAWSRNRRPMLQLPLLYPLLRHAQPEG